MQAAGVLAALLSSAIGGTAIVATRFLAAAFDPITLGAVRFVGGAAVLLPIAMLARSPWPRRRDWAGTVVLGLLVVNRGEIQQADVIGTVVVVAVTLSLVLHSVSAAPGIRGLASAAGGAGG